MSSGREAVAAVEAALHEHPEALVPPLQASQVEGGWLVQGEGVELTVTSTGALSGTARVDPLAARARLFALMCFAIAAAWSGVRLFELAVLLITVPLRLLGANRLIDASVATGITLVGTLWLAARFTQWVATLRPELLDEPAATTAEGLARWPAPGGVDELLRRSVLLMVPTLVFLALTAYAAWSAGNRLSAVLSLLGLLPVLLIMVEAARVAPRPAGTKEPPARSGGSWGELITTGLLGSRLSLGVVLFGMGAKASGLLDGLASLTASRVPLWSELLDTALQLAVIAAVLVGKPSHGRRAAALALLGGLVGERLGGQPLKLVVIGLVLFLSLRAAHRGSNREALRMTLEFEALLAAGRILGRILAGLFLGPMAISLGEAIGEQFVALSASSRLEPLEVAARVPPRPVSKVLALGLAAAAFLLVTVGVLRPWRTLGPEAPSSWSNVSGPGWTARMPGKPGRQTAKAFLPRLGDSVPVHHTTSIWRGSVFMVFEVEWPAATVELDRDGFLTTGELLPFQQVNSCEGLIIGVTRDNSARCVTSASRERLIAACVLSDALGAHLAEGELAFFTNLKADPEPAFRGLGPSTSCVLDPKTIRELNRLVAGMR